MSQADDSDGLFPSRVGDRLRIAREAMGLSLDEIAGRTRVPSRHLATIESGDLGRLPAAPYSAGFIKSYARVVGLDEAEMSRAFRDELAMYGDDTAASLPFAPADPSRIAPRTLAWVAALIAVLLVGGYVIWRNTASGGADEHAQLAAGTAPPAAPEIAAAPPQAQYPTAPAPVTIAAATPMAPPAPIVTPGGVVALTARQPVWIRVYERDGNKTLFMGTLALGQRYEVPPDAVDPLVRTGRAESIQVSVGAAAAPPLGPPAKTLRDVSLKPEAVVARPRTYPVVQIAAPIAAGAPPPGAATTGLPDDALPTAPP